jgi:hypothetical protein
MFISTLFYYLPGLLTKRKYTVQTNIYESKVNTPYLLLHELHELETHHVLAQLGHRQGLFYDFFKHATITKHMPLLTCIVDP